MKASSTSLPTRERELKQEVNEAIETIELVAPHAGA